MPNKFVLASPFFLPLLALISSPLVLFLINFVNIAVSVEMVVNGGTTQTEDMANAMAIRARHFWRALMADWDCQSNRLKKLEQLIGFGKSHAELVHFCEHWKMMAMAANAYVKSWKCKQEQAAHLGQMKENPFKCLCVKPLFRVGGQNELQMSSAMEAIQAVYRDLFKWGQGKNMVNNEITFENQKAWDSVDRWRFAYKNSAEIGQMQKARQMLSKAKKDIEKDNDVYYISYEDSQFAKQFPPERTPTFSRASTALIDALNDKLYGETKTKYDTVRTRIIDEFESMLKQFEELNAEIIKKLSKDKNMELGDWERTHGIYVKLWEIVRELGLDMSSICDAGQKFGAINSAQQQQSALSKLIKNMFGTLLARGSLATDRKAHEQKAEERLGQTLWAYTHFIYVPMMEKHGNDDGDGLKVVKDPCEEAKLKVRALLVDMADG